MKANSDKYKQSNKATRRVLAGVLCGASVLSLVLSLVMPPISQAIANDVQAGAAEETIADGATGVDGTNVMAKTRIVALSKVARTTSQMVLSRVTLGINLRVSCRSKITSRRMATL